MEAELTGSEGSIVESDDGKVSSPFTKTSNQKDVEGAIGSTLVWAGCLIFILLLLQPVLDALRMLQDPIIFYFVGDSFGTAVLALCIGFTVAWVLGVWSFFRFARREGITQLSVVSLIVTSLTALGLCMLVIAAPAATASKGVYEDLFECSAISPVTAELTAYSAVLQEMRQTPGCADVASVEDCPGYEASYPYTDLLKTMEEQYKCAGFCSSPAAVPLSEASNASNASSTVASNVSLLSVRHRGPISLRDRVLQASYRARVEASHRDQHSAELPVGIASASSSVSSPQPPAQEMHTHLGRKRTKKHAQGTMLLDTGEGSALIDANGQVTTEAVQQLSESEASSRDNEPPSITHPPTLFTTANYQASCEGMAARDVMMTVHLRATFLYDEGIILLVFALTASMLKLVDMCAPSALRRKTVY